jgi:hypothetical protein
VGADRGVTELIAYAIADLSTLPPSEMLMPAGTRARSRTGRRRGQARRGISCPNFRRNAEFIIDAGDGPDQDAEATTCDRDREWAWNCHRSPKPMGQFSD